MIRVILTGATGMVGEGVLLECLENPAVAEVLMVNRSPSPRRHPKLKECLVPDFFDLSAVTPQLAGYGACFFCAGVSSVGKSEVEYTRLTYDLTLHFARTLVELNPETLNRGMVFVYVSGAMTDSSEQGRSMWARVKGRTENALQRLAFRAVYNFRPGFMRAMPGQQNLPFFYRLIGPLYPLVRAILPNQVSTLSDVGRAMIRCAVNGYPKSILEVRDINAFAKS
ncbi:MAG TPA: NAD-dependent epimerase/dehydratase family protein [Acidobacteriaceae bacterium]|nr:NAD-dependent epimerase/dehydratase family protein [Acidobacteriaceae bacterium]